MNVKVWLLLVPVFLTGCASYSGVVPVGQDTYMITKQQATGFPGLGNLETDVISDGYKYCQSQDRKFHLASVQKTNPPYILGNYPRVEIQFMCLQDGDPRLRETVLRKDPDTVIKVTQ